MWVSHDDDDDDEEIPDNVGLDGDVVGGAPREQNAVGAHRLSHQISGGSNCLGRGGGLKV